MEGPRYCSWAPDRLLQNPIVRRMEAEPFGAYCSLLLEAWLDPSGSLPTDDATLAALARLDAESWSILRRDVLLGFYEEDGRLWSVIVDDARERAAGKSRAAKFAVDERERRRAERRALLESSDERPMVEGSSDDEQETIEGSSKEKVKVKVKKTTVPLKRRLKALQTGDPTNDATWAQFHDVYPRPSNGRKLEKAEARVTWDLLAQSGQDMEAVLAGAKRYREWIDALQKHEYVAMMTTWLNKRSWTESYCIAPTSEDGKRIQAKKEEEAHKARKEHEEFFRGPYEAYVANLVSEGISDPDFQESWRAKAESTLEKARTTGLPGAIKMAESLLNDPEQAREDQARMWRGANPVLSFWQWDDKLNPEGLK